MIFFFTIYLSIDIFLLFDTPLQFYYTIQSNYHHSLIELHIYIFISFVCLFQIRYSYTNKTIFPLIKRNPQFNSKKVKSFILPTNQLSTTIISYSYIYAYMHSSDANNPSIRRFYRFNYFND